MKRTLTDLTLLSLLTLACAGPAFSQPPTRVYGPTVNDSSRTIAQEEKGKIAPWSWMQWIRFGQFYPRILYGYIRWSFNSTNLPPGSTISQVELKFKAYPHGSDPPQHASFHLYDVKLPIDWSPSEQYAAFNESNRILDGTTVTENNEETFTTSDPNLLTAVQNALNSGRNYLTLGFNRNPEYEGGSYDWDLNGDGMGYTSSATLQIWFTPPQYSIQFKNDLGGTSYGNITVGTQQLSSGSSLPFYWGDQATVAAYSGKYQYSGDNWKFQTWTSGQADNQNPKAFTFLESGPIIAYFNKVYDLTLKNDFEGYETGTLLSGQTQVNSGYVVQDIFRQEYRSFGAITPQTDAGLTWKFIKWTDGVTSQNRNEQVTSTKTYTAWFKAHNGSNLSSATGTTGQRKMMWFDGYHKVYESSGDIWYTKSVEGETWTDEFMVSRGAGKAHNPSIAERGWDDNVLYVTWVDTTVRSGATGYDICVRRLNLSTSQWGSTEAIVHPDLPSGTGFARGDARPVAVAYSESNTLPHVIVAYEGAGTGIRYSLKSYNDYYGTSVWKTEVVSTTGTNSGRPSMTLGHDAGWNNMYLVLTYDSTYAIRIATSTNFQENPICSYVLFNTPVTIPGSAAFFMHAYSCVDVDNTGRQHITWRALDEGLGGSDVALHRSRDLSGSWSVLNEFVSELVDGPSVTTSISANLDGAGGTILFSDRSNLLNYASSDGINWDFLGYTYYPTGVRYPNLVPKSFLFEEASIVTKNSSLPYEVKFELRDNSGGLRKSLAVHDQMPDPNLIRHYDRIDLADTSGDAWFALALGNSMLVDQSGAVIRKIDFTCSGDGAGGGPGLRSIPFTLPSGISFTGDVRVVGKAPGTGAEISLKLVDSKTGVPIAALLRQQVDAGSRIQFTDAVNSTVVGTDQSRELAVIATVGGIDAAHFVTDSVQMTIVRGSPSALKKQQISEEEDALPAVFALHPNYPNPFNPTTTIRYDLPTPGNVSLVVYDVLGRAVSELVKGFLRAGSHSVTWDASSLASGFYLARLVVVDEHGKERINKVHKLILTK